MKKIVLTEEQMGMVNNYVSEQESDNENKRYVVQMDVYVYADNDYMAQKRAHNLKLSIENRLYSDHVRVREIGEQPFASTYYRKLDDPTFTPKDTSNDEPLPF